MSGRGFGLSSVMARFSAEVRIHLRAEVDLAAAVRHFNTAMQPLARTDRFMTLVALLLDPATHTVTVVNAGHPGHCFFAAPPVSS